MRSSMKPPSLDCKWQFDGPIARNKLGEEKDNKKKKGK